MAIETTTHCYMMERHTKACPTPKPQKNNKTNKAAPQTQPRQGTNRAPKPNQPSQRAFFFARWRLIERFAAQASGCSAVGENISQEPTERRPVNKRKTALKKRRPLGRSAGHALTKRVKPAVKSRRKKKATVSQRTTGRQKQTNPKNQNRSKQSPKIGRAHV